VTGPETAGGDQRVFRLLFVCTANQCRSPMAEVIASHECLVRGIAAEVASAGLMAGGMPASRGATRATAARGLDLSRHESRTVTAELLGMADLVLAMERRHLIQIAELDMGFLERSFTLRGLADLASLLGPRPPAESPGSWIGRAAGARDRATVLAHRPGDDLPDPMGGSRRDYRRTADEIHRRVSRILTMLFPDHPAPAVTSPSG